jgi:hypothetical protein
MNPINTIKHAPRWAWFAGAGVGLGVIGIRIFRDRAAPNDSSQTASTVGDGTSVTSGANSPVPVVVPPIITGTDGNGQADAAGILTAVGGVFAPTIDTLSGLVVTVVGSNEQNLQTYASGLGTFNDQWISLLASGGLAPAPAASQPSVINVNVPTPAPVAAGVATSSPNAGKSCPSSHPKWNPGNGAPGPK